MIGILCFFGIYITYLLHIGGFLEDGVPTFQRWDMFPFFFWRVPLPETNMAPENNPLEVWRFLFETIIFRCELLVSGSVGIQII